MKQHYLIINSEAVKERALRIVSALPLDVPSEITIKPYKADRTIAQNSLYWRWLTIIGGELGESKNDLHERYKKDFLVPIFARDERKQYALILKRLRTLYAHDREMALDLLSHVVKLASTREASTAQFSEYLNDIEHDARSMNIFLPHPDDYLFAMEGQKCKTA